MPRRSIALGVVVLAIAAGAVYLATRPPRDSGGDSLVTPPSDDGGTSGNTGPWIFQDVTADSGIQHTYRNGEESEYFTILESLGGGVLLIDYDRDGKLDIFVTGGGKFEGASNAQIKGLPCRLYRNLGGMKFQDVSAATGIDQIDFYSHGGAVADYDRDGWPDLLVTGYGKLRLLHNEADPSGGRRFVDVSSKVGLVDRGWPTSAAFADMNGDGYPDLYVCHYVDWSFENNPECKGDLPGVKRQVCPPQKFKPLVHAFYWNEGGKRFRDATKEQNFQPVGCGLGVIAADLNGDGRPDFYVANDATNNQLYFNRGGKLEEKGLSAGVALDDDGNYDGSMGTDVGDYDGTGRASIFVTNFQGDEHALYQNRGNEIFQWQTRAAGIARIGQHFVGFGTGFLDFDNDGWEDIVIAHGHVLQHPFGGSTYRQKPVLLKNTVRNSKRFFDNVSSQAGPFFAVPQLGRGLAIGDLDDDGRTDLVFSHTNSPVALLRNVSVEAERNHWIGIELVGKENRCIVGSTIQVDMGDRKITRFVKGGGSYLSNYDSRQLFGLGNSDRPVSIIIRWSWGETEKVSGLKPNAYWEIHEGRANQATPKTNTMSAR